MTAHWINEQVPEQGDEAVLHTVAASQRVVWAFGIRVNDSNKFDTMVFCRNVLGWQRIAAPGIGRVNRAIAFSDADAWAVGDGRSLHWDGTRWRLVPLATLTDARTQMFGLAQFGTEDVWTAGYAPRRDRSGARGTVQRWDGERWTDLPMPAVASSWGLAGIGGVAGDDLWAVGRGQAGHSVALHWDGKYWQQVPVPGPSNAVEKLCDVVALTSNDVWAAGYRVPLAGEAGNRQPFAAHWDGNAWSFSQVCDEPSQIWQLVRDEGCIWGIGYTNVGLPLVARLSGSHWQLLPGPAPPPGAEHSGLHGGAILPDGRLIVVGATSKPSVPLLPFASSRSR